MPHRQAAGNMEAANRNRQAGIAEGTGDIEGARILVGLDDDGYVIRWWREMIPSNSLAALYGIAAECAE
ncbi:hypothetical protein ACC753_37085, partial [Rhizobium ruizarguesonis]